MGGSKGALVKEQMPGSQRTNHYAKRTAMTKKADAIISELKKDKRFFGTCPRCGMEFRIADASLFSIDEKHPEAALAAINIAKEKLALQKAQIAAARERMTKKAENTAQAVNLGKIIEKIVPSFASFTYETGDCRALFEPIDYMIFSGLTERAAVEAIYFVDVKSGGARLNSSQRLIRDAVGRGAVKFSLIK
jgi:predicted Holliday junction resolvase-like endonuclease